MSSVSSITDQLEYASYRFTVPMEAVNGTYTVVASSSGITQNASATFVVFTDYTVAEDIQGELIPGSQVQVNVSLANPSDNLLHLLFIVQVFDPEKQAIYLEMEWMSVQPYSVFSDWESEPIPVTVLTGEYLFNGQMLTELPRNRGYCLAFDSEFVLVGGLII